MVRLNGTIGVVAADDRADVRERTLAATAPLMTVGGLAATTTRAVATAAEVRAPTLDRFFGDNDGLLEAVAVPTMATHVAAKGGIRTKPIPSRTLASAGTTNFKWPSNTLPYSS